MALYTCPRCNNKFYLSNNDMKSEDFQKVFRCSSCGATYNDIPADDLEIEQTPRTPSKEHTGTQSVVASSAASSTVGKAIKVVSIIVLVLCAIGAAVVSEESLAIGQALLVVSVLFGLLSYGIGEIICLLQSINDKMK